MFDWQAQGAEAVKLHGQRRMSTLAELGGASEASGACRNDGVPPWLTSAQRAETMMRLHDRRDP